MREQTVIGIFDYGIDAQMAAQQLMSSGIPSEKIDVIVRGSAERTATHTNTLGNSPHVTGTHHQHDRDRSFFDSLFTNREESDKYTDVAKHGSIVTVHTQSEEEAKRAAELLDKYGAIDVEERAEKYRTVPQEERGNWINSSVPIIEENMHAGKREVETGGIRVRSRIIERPVEEHLRLREEQLHVERNPSNRSATEQDFATFQRGETTIIEHTEVPIINKEARVVEEVRVGKETVVNDETVRDTVRKTDVEIDDLRTNNDDINRNTRKNPDTL